MDVIKLARIIIKRWAVVGPVLLLGVAGTVLVVSRIPPDYTSSVSLLVVSQNATAPEVTASVLAASMQNEAAARGVRMASGDSYSVNVGDDDVIRVVATAGTRAGAVSLANGIVDRLGPVLRQQRSAFHLAGPGPTLQILSRARQLTTTQLDRSYQAVGTARLVPVATGGGIGDLGKLVAAAMSGAQTVAEIQSAGGSTSYVPVAAKTLPLVTVTIKGTSPTAVTRTATLLTGSANRRLAEILALADQPAGTATVKSLGAPAQPTNDSRGVFRALVALLALTAAVAVAAAMVMESIIEHRSSSQPEYEVDGAGSWLPADVGRRHRSPGLPPPPGSPVTQEPSHLLAGRSPAGHHEQ